MHPIIEGIIDGVIQTSALEWIAVICGVASVIYSMRENILVYPTGIVSVLIYVYLAFVYKLYADMGVNGYYFVMSVYGWYYWTNTDGKKDQIPVSINSFKENIYSVAILLGSFGLLVFILKNYTDSDVPIWDATTTAFAILGMWLMARKKLENWIAWIITDIISIPLYFHKGLVLTSFQFLMFTVLATMGYFSWKKSLESQATTSN
ncbi:MAG TPA: nicotinamide mononucleotide transporter [Balneola sp.]|jgi:nicotinamide mononucleotide transporter|nr:nicotinamide mononucleotide transporter [Bacteroidota bacterium]HCT52761.1 nicotinamide mononucleotide transporter [Balneola sp.]|tara:strand:+ start:184 stop:801 length:618 start_codon:yes stop_codon:yes gene_type:complete